MTSEYLYDVSPNFLKSHFFKFALIFLLAIVRDQVGPTVVACFVQSWAIYRPSLGQFNVSDVDPNLCTHVVYCFAGMDPLTNDITLLDLDKDSGESFFFFNQESSITRSALLL